MALDIIDLKSVKTIAYDHAAKLVKELFLFAVFVYRCNDGKNAADFQLKKHHERFWVEYLCVRVKRQLLIAAHRCFVQLDNVVQIVDFYICLNHGLPPIIFLIVFVMT